MFSRSRPFILDIASNHRLMKSKTEMQLLKEQYILWYFLSNTFKAREAIKIKGVVIGELWGDRNAPSPMINRIFSICIPRVKQICKSKSTFAAQSQPMI